ncbi:MAG TPA: hypothetical protein VGQ46_14445 [Thermoanaerobaculia bacterium]|jgi:hypothetical protein|nr:hypothetical protein [Thermoanaerobaculia bacterium]
MKRIAIVVSLVAAVNLTAQVPTARIASDAKVIDRVAEASTNDLPKDLLKRIVNEDIDLLRGKRADGTYQYASYDRMEAGRKSDSFSIDPEHKESVLELRDVFPYRLIINVPSRRMMVAKNHHIYIDRVEIETLPQTSTEKKFQTVKVDAWLEPGNTKTIDLGDIGKQATARVYAHAEAGGYANVTLTFIEARIFDEPSSPYADAVESAKAIVKAIDHGDKSSIRAMAQRISSAFPTAAATVSAPMGAPPATIAATPAASQVNVTAGREDPETMTELQAIEDLLTGTEAERRQGVDRLHQLLRRLRNTSH